MSWKYNNEPNLHLRYAAAEFGASIKDAAEAKEAYEVCMTLVYIKIYSLRMCTYYSTAERGCAPPSFVD